MEDGHVLNYHCSPMEVQATSFIRMQNSRKSPLLIMKPQTKKMATVSMFVMAVIADQHYALLYVPSEI